MLGVRRGTGRVERFLARLPAPGRTRPSATVLCYHSLDPEGGPHTSATPAQFGHHLDWLATAADVVPLAAVARRLSAPGGERPVVALTFDDGYRDSHVHALQALAARGLTATFFVTSGFIDDLGDTRARMAGHWSDAPPGLQAMTWGEVRELADAGMEIGGHTRTHRDLAGLSPAEVRREIGDDRDRLEDRLGRPVASLAYPFGRPGRHVTPAVADAARQAGLQRAMTISFRRVGPDTSPLAMPRIPVHHDTTDLLAAKLAGRLDLLGRLQDGRRQAAPRPLAA